MNHKGSALSFVLLGTAAVFLLAGCDQASSLAKKYQQKPEQESSKMAEPVKEKKPSYPPLESDEVARVGSWRLTIDEFNEIFTNLKATIPNLEDSFEFKDRVLKELIEQQKLAQDAKMRGLDKRDDLSKAINAFETELLFRSVIEELTQDIQVTEADALTFYEENKQNFIDPIELKVSEILAYTETAAKDILVQLIQGADFAAVARANSKAESANNGGDLGYISQAPFEQMTRALIALEVGQHSNVFEGPEGFYIVKIEDRRGGNPRAFDALKEEIIAYLTGQRQQEAVLNYLQEITQKIPSEVNEDLLK